MAISIHDHQRPWLNSAVTLSEWGDGRSPLLSAYSLLQELVQALKVLDLPVHDTVANVGRRMDVPEGRSHPVSQSLTAKLAELALPQSAFNLTHQPVDMPIGHR